jgi:hypothetical protein
MKAPSIIIVFLILLSGNSFAQKNSITGKITDVKPHFAGQYALTVGEATLVLLVDNKDSSEKKFQINKKYRDLLIKSKDTFILNPKYSNKIFKVSYTINGKGWKCINTIQLSEK